MKVVFFGYDFSLGILQRLLHDGHEVAKVYTFETDNTFMFNVEIKQFCEQNSIPIATKKMKEKDVQPIMDLGAECLISCGYPNKIPPPDFSKTKAINIHPTLLPDGKGIMPMPKLLLEHPDCAGITVHKLTEKFDSGDILYQGKIDLAPDDDIEILNAKVVMRLPDIASKVMANFDIFWENAKPQDGQGSWWSPYPDSVRTYDWTQTVDEMNRHIRAFGRYGMIAEFHGRRWFVAEAKAWTEPHNHEPGTITASLSTQLVIAIADGYVILKEVYTLEGPNT